MGGGKTRKGEAANWDLYAVMKSKRNTSSLAIARQSGEVPITWSGWIIEKNYEVVSELLSEWSEVENNYGNSSRKCF